MQYATYNNGHWVTAFSRNTGSNRKESTAYSEIICSPNCSDFSVEATFLTFVMCYIARVC